MFKKRLLLRPLLPLLKVLSHLETALLSKWMQKAYKRKFTIDWFLDKEPEFFDHHIDLYYQWLHSRNSLWLERGVFSSLALNQGDVLELACGDGFNARNFYSLRSKKVIACDFDPKAIHLARTKNAAPNVEYQLQDIRQGLPMGQFDNIIWDAAIEHFTEIEIVAIMKQIKSRLTKNGILSGYTILEKSADSKHLSHHEYEFKSKEDLMRFLSPYFKHVSVFETVYPDRHNLYFWASDDSIPFQSEWKNNLYRAAS